MRAVVPVRLNLPKHVIHPGRGDDALGLHFVVGWLVPGGHLVLLVPVDSHFVVREALWHSMVGVFPMGSPAWQRRRISLVCLYLPLAHVPHFLLCSGFGLGLGFPPRFPCRFSVSLLWNGACFLVPHLVDDPVLIEYIGNVALFPVGAQLLLLPVVLASSISCPYDFAVAWWDVE